MLKPYTCVRCGYNSNKKSNITNHFKRKTECPGSENLIELTDEIKEHILKNRIYKIPKEKKEPTIVNNIQYNNTINNYVKNMDTFDKLDRLMTHKNSEILCLEENINKNFGSRVDKLSNDKFKHGYDLGNDRLFDIIDEISQIRGLEDMNIVYDDKLKELSLYKYGSWENYLVDRGVREVVSLMKDNFLDYYEQYLLRKIHVTEKNEIVKQKYREYLEEYYKFITSFDLKPFVEGKDDCDILGMEDGDYGSYVIEEKYMNNYKTISNNMKRYDINKTKKSLDNILKNNTKRSIKELNKQVMSLVISDEEFKNSLDLQESLSA